MEIWIQQFMSQFGNLGVFLLIFIENVFPPIPSELILTFGGFMTTYTKMNIIGVVLSSTVGSVFGAILLYQIGHLVPREKLESLLEGRIGKILHFKPEDVGSAMEWFDSKGNYTVLFCRFIPIVRSLISIPAGMAHMNLGTFLSLTTIGSFIWNLVLVTLGAIAGTSWQKAAECLGTYTQVARVVILVFALVGILVYIKRRFLQK